MNKIVVTGGLGFIGSNLIDLLIKNGFFVLNIDKVSYASNFYNTLNFKNNKNYKYLKLNINNKNKLTKIFAKYKPLEIFNLAAETHVDRSIDSPDQLLKEEQKKIILTVQVHLMQRAKHRRIILYFLILKPLG